MIERKIGFIGGGNMAQSLIGGLINSGISPENISVAEPLPSLRAKLKSKFDVKVTAKNSDVAESVTLLVLAVKPQIMQEAITSIKNAVALKPVLVISVAAGINIQSIETWFGGRPAVVRVMPNTPALIGAGISGLFANSQVTLDGRENAAQVMKAVGNIVWLQNEGELDLVTAVSGSGPAYFFYLMEAIERVAVSEGLDPTTARTLTVETAIGAGRLALASPDSLAVLRKQVTSPGGTTEAAINSLDESQVSESVGKAVKAAKARSEELSQFLGTEDHDKK
ncbi:MAG: pyrroline-5-carboxylate reductase [Proteobacteria bacterium]|nr:pyrroline-5-carboxylate reductase [Pseudomonadota bacterium]